MPESRTAPPAPPRAKGPGIGTAITVLIALTILMSLGVWQLRRMTWKEGLLHRVAALQHAPAVPLGQVLAAGGDLDYVRVATTCPDLERRPLLRLFSVRDGVAGYRLIAACPVAAGPVSSILVDRGFVSTEGSAAAMRPGRDVLPGPVIGVLRAGDKATFVTPANQAEANLWYSRDPASMAKALGAVAPAPVFLMLEQPAPGPAGPAPAPLPLSIPNRHFEYALTWFGLAASLVAVYVAMLLRKRPR